MFNRLKILTEMQLKNRKGKKKTKLGTTASVLIQAVVCIAITAVLVFLLNFVKSMSLLPINESFFTFLLFITQAISVITCVFGLTNILYTSKDNSVIFSMPVHPSEIFISRLLVFYISELKRNLNFVIPFCIAFGIVLNLNVLFFVFVAVMVFLLPLIPVLLGAIFSLPLMYIKKLLNKVPILKILLALAIIAIVVWLLISITMIIPRPLRIVALYDKFYAFVQNTVLDVNAFSTIFGCIANLMLGKAVWANLGIIVGSLIVMLGFTFIITLLYFNIATQSFEHANKPRKNQINKPSKNTFLAFVKKELIINLRNTSTFISHLVYLIGLPVLLFVVNEIISAIDINLYGVAIAFAVDVLIGLMFLTASNTISASAITSEGSEFSLIKTAPSNTSTICYAKLLINFSLSLVGIVCSIVVLAITSKFNVLSLIIMLVTFLVVNTAHMLWSMQIDILNPKLLEFSTTGNLRDSKNNSKSLVIGLAVAVVFGVITFLCFLGMDILNMLKLLLIAGLFFALRLYLFHINLKVYFNKIQF